MWSKVELFGYFIYILHHHKVYIVLYSSSIKRVLRYSLPRYKQKYHILKMTTQTNKINKTDLRVILKTLKENNKRINVFNLDFIEGLHIGFKCGVLK